MRLVIMGAISSIPSASRAFSTTSAGLGVILSIMLHGKDTFVSSSSHATNSLLTCPFFNHSSATVTTLLFSFSPLWLQLSMLTTAIGVAPASKRSSKSAATMLMAWCAFLGPTSISAFTTGRNSPCRLARA